MSHIRPSRLLKAALLADIVISGGLAALQLLLARPLGALLALPQPLLVESGLFMLGYGLLLAWMLSRPALARGLVRLVAFGNLGWALGCLALALSGLVAPSAWGLGFLLMHALGVTGLATLQLLGLRDSAPATAAPAGARTLHQA